MSKTLLTAHSGCDGTKDNSMAFVSYALALAVDCIEADIRRDGKGTLVLAHDEGPACAALREAFSMLAAHPGKKLNCDLKQEGLELDVWTLARQMGVDGQILFSGTVSHDAAKEEPALFERVDWFVNIELLFPRIRTLGLAAAVEALGAPFMAEELQAFMSMHKARCVNAHHAIASTPLYGELMERKIPVSLWTPDDEQTILRFWKDGVYNITTRNARRACEITGKTHGA